MRSEAEKKIQFHYLVKPFSFSNRTRLKQSLLKLFKREGKRVEHINYIFCTDSYLLQINKSFLNHDSYTDIITFELSKKGTPLLADIYISIERIKENAANFKVPFTKELHRVVFHGALHLCGYKDKKKEERELMRKMEEKYLNLYFA